MSEYSDEISNDTLQDVRKMDKLNWREMLVIIITMPIAVVVEWIKKIKESKWK